MDLISYRSIVDAKIDQFLATKFASYQEYNLPERVFQIVTYTQKICGAGKRVRPYLVYLSYKAYGGEQDEDIMTFSLGFELFHAFALIHDDVFDQGTTRHGVSTYHKYVETLLEGDQAEHIAASQAILAGDLLFSRVQEVIYDDYAFDACYLSQARKNFQRMLNEIILGEMMDVDFMTRDVIATTDEIRLKDHLKTASYSLIRPMMTGAMLAGATGETLDRLALLGKNLGGAYQLKDDLEDLTLSPEETDKTLFSDIQEGDQTFFTDYIFQSGNDEYISLLTSLRGKTLTPENIEELQIMFEASGAIAHAKVMIKKYLHEAETLLREETKMLDEYKAHFFSIVELLRV